MARTLAATEHSDLLVDVLALEKECSENIPQLRADIPYRDPVQRIVDRRLFIQYIFLILGIIADIDIVADLGFTGERLQLTHRDVNNIYQNNPNLLGR